MPKILENAREKVIAEARRQLVKNGYAGMTIRSVAGACGLGVGTVYNYFESKDMLIASLMLEDWQRALSSMRCGSDGEPMAVVRNVYAAIRDFSELYSKLFADGSASAAYAVAPPVFSGTFVFVGLMVVGLGLMDACLCVISAKMRKPALIALFAVSFVCSLGMGYLSSQDFAQASMNWIAQFVNIAGQGTFLAGAALLHKNGLAQLKLK